MRFFPAPYLDDGSDLDPTIPPPVSEEVTLVVEEPPQQQRFTPIKEDKSRHKNRFKALLPDIEGLAREVVEADIDHTKAIEVSNNVDDLVEWAPNVIEFCISRRFLGARPYAKQAQILINLFEEYCYPCSDIDYLKNIPVKDSIETILSKVTMLHDGVCPHCGFTKADGRKLGVFRDPQEVVIVVGQRSGKSAGTAMAISYLVHMNLRLACPWKNYGLTPGQSVTFTITAKTVKQADKSLWGTFKGMFNSSPWLKKYKEVCDAEGKKVGIKETVRLNETFIRFEHKFVEILLEANEAGSLRGSTRIGGAIDELSYFSEEGGRVRSNGFETHTSLNNSCSTVRLAVLKQIEKDPACNWPNPIMFNISSPKELNDPLMTMYRKSVGDVKIIRGHWATWEFSPDMTKEVLTKLGYMSLPTAARDYGAQPPLAEDPLIEDSYIIKDAFQSPMATSAALGKLIRPSAIGYVDDLDLQSGDRFVSYLTAKLGEQPERPPTESVRALVTEESKGKLGHHIPIFEALLQKPLHERTHILGVDLGTTNNALALVAGCLVGNVFITDFALEIKPKRNRPANIAKIYEDLILPLIDELNVVGVFYDQWNSVHALHDLAVRFGAMGPLHSGHQRKSWLKGLRDKGQLPAMLAERVSMTTSDAQLIVSKLEQQEFLFPEMEVPMLDLVLDKTMDPSKYPFSHLAMQMATVRVKGNRLLKPTGGDDDLFRAWSNIAYKVATDDLVVDLLKQDGRSSASAKKQNSGNLVLSVFSKGKRRGDIPTTTAHSPSGSATVTSTKGFVTVRRAGGRR